MAFVDEDPWARHDVSDWDIGGVETTGSTTARWLIDPEDGSRWLHKDTVIPRNGIEQGEDWSEVISTRVAGLLGVSCAATRLCVRKGRRGSLSLSVTPRGYDLWEGTVMLKRAEVPGYHPHAEGERGVDPERPEVKRPGHNLANIKLALDGVLAPPGFEGPSAMDGFDVFAGYMILDALIANRDRHEQNWAVLIPRLMTSPERLAPSYDHASSLGYNLLDAERASRTGAPGRLLAWAENGTAYRYEHTGKTAPTLVAHAVRAVGMCSSQGAHWWRDRLADTDLGPVLAALDKRMVPGMSEPAAMFCCDLLRLNLRRLRDELNKCA